MDCWPAWFQVAFGLLLGFIIGVGIVTLVILAEVKKLVLWAKREVRVAKEELKWLRPWAEGVSRRIRRCNYMRDEGDFWGVNMADVQTQVLSSLVRGSMPEASPREQEGVYRPL